MNALQSTNQEFAPIEIERRETGALVLRRAKAAIIEQPFLFFFGAVLTLATVYYVLLAAPLYVSSTEFAVRGKSDMSSAPLIAAIVGQPEGGVPDSVALSNYIQSQDVLSQLDKKYHLRELYSKSRPDFLNRLWNNASQEDFLQFYNRMVTANVDLDNNIITVNVQSFDPVSARTLANAILEISSKFADSLSLQMRDESTRAAKSDMASAQAAVDAADQKVTDFRHQFSDLDPNVYGAANGQAIIALQGQIYALRAQIAAMMTYSTSNSPLVKQDEAQISAMQQQITQLESGLYGKNGDSSVTNQITVYQGLLGKQLYAQQYLLTTQAEYDQARSIADQKAMFVVPITAANLPQKSTEPQRLLGILGTLLIALTLYGIVRLTLTSIRDHRGL